MQKEVGLKSGTEHWVDILDYKGIYQVSSLGHIRRLESRDSNGRLRPEQIIKPIVQHSGYAHVGLWWNQKCKQTRVHRLVAQAFIPNPDNKPTVNHINENKLDNRVENLEWATVGENTRYGTCLRRRAISRGRDIEQLDLAGNSIRRWLSIADALRSLGKNPRDGHISSVCRGNQKTAFGYKWRYVKDGD